MSKTKMLQAPDTLRDNPIDLDKDAISGVVKDLNGDLATCYTLYHQVKKHHWLVEGPEYYHLHKFLDEWAAALVNVGDLLAERITALGGYPVSGPAAQEKLSLITMEQEGMFDLRSMLTKDQKDGAQVAVALREHIRAASKAGDFGTEHLLKEILYEHEQLVHHLDHFLERTSLVTDLVK